MRVKPRNTSRSGFLDEKSRELRNQTHDKDLRSITIKNTNNH
jgi:hypothetical protein